MERWTGIFGILLYTNGSFQKNLEIGWLLSLLNMDYVSMSKKLGRKMLHATNSFYKSQSTDVAGLYGE